MQVSHAALLCVHPYLGNYAHVVTACSGKLWQSVLSTSERPIRLVLVWPQTGDASCKTMLNAVGAATKRAHGVQQRAHLLLAFGAGAAALARDLTELTASSTCVAGSARYSVCWSVSSGGHVLAARQCGLCAGYPPG